ncbi:MAG: hypothetical protein C4523_20065 [Myxococcales bacterium]|nr:MAG: hypothetical protein C4523_20065 [Myxococcales bacterium]
MSKRSLFLMTIFGLVLLLAVLSFLATACSGDDFERTDGDGAEQPSDGDDDDREAEAEPDGEDVIDPGLRLRSEGWLRGDLHMHSKWSDGGDATAMVIAIGEYLENEIFLEAHPEYAGNGLDFISITDHRTADTLTDPDWRSERLILVPGEELGSDGHANLFGITEMVSHDPGNDGTTLDDLLAAIETVHGMGGAFSINHPFTPGDPWPWDTRTHDAVEVWNTKWAMQTSPLPEEYLTEWEASRGPASPLFRRAIQESQDQVLRFYEAMLARGLHVALVGGSDRHVLFMNGFPTTWIKPEGGQSAGVVQGILARHTFVSRTPVAATVEMTINAGDGSAQMGDAVQIPPAGATVTIHVRAGRAAGGLIRLMKGSAVASDEALPEAPLGQVLAEAAIESEDFVFDVADVPVQPGDWIYPMVLEPLYAPSLSDEQKQTVDELAGAAFGMTGEDYGTFAMMFVDLIDLGILLDPSKCDPDAWDLTKLQCLPLVVNGEPTSTFFVPDWVDRALNAVPEEGAPGEWCMGAIGSAVMFVE